MIAVYLILNDFFWLVTTKNVFIKKMMRRIIFFGLGDSYRNEYSNWKIKRKVAMMAIAPKPAIPQDMAISSH
jgi:hypothetical protein